MSYHKLLCIDVVSSTLPITDSETAKSTDIWGSTAGTEYTVKTTAFSRQPGKTL